MRDYIISAALLCLTTVTLAAQTKTARIPPVCAFGGGSASMRNTGANLALQTGPHPAFSVHFFAERDLA